MPLTNSLQCATHNAVISVKIHQNQPHIRATTYSQSSQKTCSTTTAQTANDWDDNRLMLIETEWNPASVAYISNGSTTQRELCSRMYCKLTEWVPVMCSINQSFYCNKAWQNAHLHKRNAVKHQWTKDKAMPRISTQEKYSIETMAMLMSNNHSCLAGITV